MTTVAMLTGIRELIALAIEMSWRGFAYILDMLVTVSPLQAAMILVGMVGLATAGAMRMQKHLNKKLDKNPDQEVNLLVLEAQYSLIGAVIRFFQQLFSLPIRLILMISELFRKKDKDDEAKEEPKPVLVPTLGPSYLWSALITIGIYVLAVLSAPLIRWQLDAPAHFPTWQYVFFGHRPELAPFLPLQTYPYVEVIVLSAFWLSLWWIIARIVRLFHWDYLGPNLIKEAQNPAVLASWRTHFGVTDLAARDLSFDTWAKWLPLVALPLLGLSFLAITGDPYRVGGSPFAIALVAWLAWGLHQKMQGIYRPAQDPSTRSDRREEATAAGWTDVLRDLQRVHRVRQPKLSRPLRDVEPLAFSDQSLEGSKLIAPLLAELLPEPQRLTAMQQDVLDSISRQSFVHLDPPGNTRTLELGARDRSNDEGLRHRNQIIIAPEGAGKTTLAMLAAFNNALIHTRSSLIVVRDDDIAQRMAADFRAIVEPSTLRWNLRVRRVGGDLVEDLAQGIIPDVLVCDLQQLVTILLDDVETYRPFLTNLGLIVVDDLETFCGPVEVHAQLAMRRLDLRLRALRGVDQIGEEQAPIFLLLASETMDDLPAWARSLCGVDAVPRRFASQMDTHLRQRARQARRDVDEGGRSVGGDDDRAERTADGRKRRQLIYDLDDFKAGVGRTLSVLDIIEACEALAVPWHYRPCGDDRRLLGRSILPLKNEPQSYVDDPLLAAVIFLDGHATAVERQLANLGRAGAHFTSRVTPEPPPEEVDDKKKSADEEGEKNEETESPGRSLPDEVSPEEIEPVAVITVVDTEERVTLETFAEDGPLGDIVESLPRPFLRAPSGYLTHRHLTSELIQHWTEVADLLDIFGNEIAPILRDLSRQGAILNDPRTTLEPGRKSYEKRVFLRGLEAELLGPEGSADEADRLLPPPVEDVEVASRRNVSIRERTTLVTLGRVDAESARHRFYPGRIFESARGRHVVVDYAGDDSSREGAFEVGDVIAEPFLGDEVTTPRRRVHVDLIASQDEPLAPEPVFLGAAPLGVGLFPVRCRIRHQATFRLAARTGEIRQRIYRSERERDQESQLRTDALGLFPMLDVDGAPRATPLDLIAARHVAAAFRGVIPLLYRGADASIGLALHVGEENPDDDYVLQATDGFFFYDLHGGGNGAARAIERDGIEALLRLSHNFLLQLQDSRRALAFHDEWDGFLDDEAQRERGRLDAIAWFESCITYDEASLNGAKTGGDAR